MIASFSVSDSPGGADAEIELSQVGEQRVVARRHERRDGEIEFNIGRKGGVPRVSR